MLKQLEDCDDGRHQHVNDDQVRYLCVNQPRTPHKFQRRLLGITWKDKVRNEEIRKKIGLQWQKLQLIVYRLTLTVAI